MLGSLLDIGGFHEKALYLHQCGAGLLRDIQVCSHATHIVMRQYGMIRRSYARQRARRLMAGSYMET